MVCRPEPCVLYAHTFVHPKLDEYVDEVLFSEPVVITACEFLEQNSSSICPAVKLMGATSPPSFALEVFIHCEGDARFRRLCLPLLYSQSSSNVLEVEAVVTNHLVIRGSYRGLSMVIYGNTAEDLGQFNIEVDIDNSLTNTVSTIEGNLEDLPPAFHPSILKIKELVSPLQIISRSVVLFELPAELRKFLELTFRILDSSNTEVTVGKVTSCLLSVASTFGSPCPSYKTIHSKETGFDTVSSDGDANHILAECGAELMNLLRKLQNQYGDSCVLSPAEAFLELETEAPTTTELMNTVNDHFDFSSSTFGYSHLSQTKNIILWLSVARLLCSARESCFQFVSYGGMEYLGSFFTHQMRNSTSLQLLLLGVIDQATRHSIGCEGFLGWWPREDETLPACTSFGYNQILKLLLESRRHDIASLAAHILQRVRFYEVACKYECAVLSVLGDISASDQVMNSTFDILTTAKLQLKKLLNLLKSSGPIDDPSPYGVVSRYVILGDSGQLTYKTTRGLINKSNCRFLNQDIDPLLLSLLKEKGFLPLSAALLSSSVLRSETGHSIDLFVDVVLQFEAILTMLLFCRSGLEFLMHDYEVFSTIVDALRGIEDVQKEDCFSVRYASILLSKGFFCSPQEVGFIMEMHMKAVVAVDRLCKLTPNTEEFLWVLWDLCRLSRSECGRQAMLILVNFPEALKVLITALHSGRDPDPALLNTGVSPLNLATFHSTAEIFEVVVTDSTATSLKFWIDHANELHVALHSSSHGSNKKDAPARLLEWIDAGVVYQRNGAIGLLQYAAVLVSGGELHMGSNSVLASDMMDGDNLVGNSSCSSDGNVVDNLIGKRITGKDFPGVILRDSSIAQLTTAFRILAFISDDSVAAAALYDEGAVMVVHAVIINCKLMLEKMSNIYDFLVDEGTEGGSTSDLLLERNREKCLFDLLIPSLLLLINLLQRLKESKEQHRNTNLMDTIFQLHREASTKLAASAADFSHSCPDLAIGIGAVCHLLASALACWPVYCWTPGLFQFLLDSLHANSLLALGPKDACSIFCLLNDLLPDEGIWRWKSGIPILTPLRAISVGSLLGPKKEKQINWHLEPGNTEKLLSQLSSKLEKLGEIILHCAVSMSVVLQDILRVFVIRIACLNADYASVLVKPILSWVSHRLLEPSSLSDADTYKIGQLLKFLSLLLEHPNAKPFFLKGGVEMLAKVLDRCMRAANYDVKMYQGNIVLANNESVLLNWCSFVFHSISLIVDGRPSFQHHVMRNRNTLDSLTAEDCYAFLSYLLRFFNVLPSGLLLFNCISSFKEMVSSIGGQSALLSIVKDIKSSAIEDSQAKIREENYTNDSIDLASEWNEHPPLLSCWTTLFKSIDSVDAPATQVTSAIDMLASSILGFCVDGESLNMERLAAIKLLFGLRDDTNLEYFVKGDLGNIEELTYSLGSKMGSDASTDKIMELVKLLRLLLQQSSGKEVDPVIASSCTSLFAVPVSSRICKLADKGMEQIENLSLDIFGETFSWECPENLGNRPTQTAPSGKRKVSSLEGTGRNARGESSAGESTLHGSFSRGSVPISTAAGPTRRDAFRQRKPNTSRPPSMHVDDYVARERNADGISSSNVITVPRMGSSSGRPPSIHVDVFMARQNERQTAGLAVNDAAGQVKPTAPDENMDTDKSSESRQLRPDLDDDLQGIEIVFDADESDGPDDKLHFPQSDDNLQLPSSVAPGRLSPHSIVEETGSDVNENMDENNPSEYTSKVIASHPEMQLNRDPSISSYKNFSDQSQDARRFPSGTRNAIDPSSSRQSGSVAAPMYMNTSASLQYPVDSRLPPNLYSEATTQQGGTSSKGGVGLQGFFDPKILTNQPPLPPMPPPPTISSVTSQNRDSAGIQSSFVKPLMDPHSQVPPGFHVQSEYASSAAQFVASVSSSDLKYGRSSFSSPFVSNRPPLPPSAPYSSNPTLKNPISQPGQFIQPGSNSEVLKTGVLSSMDGAGNVTTSRPMLIPYPPHQPSLQPGLFRPGSLPISLHGSTLVSHHGESPPISVPLVQTMQILTQLQPLQPPLIPRPPPSHLRPSVPVSQLSDQRVSLLHGSVQVPAQSSQLLQQPQASPSSHGSYENQQPENLSHSLPPPQQQDSGTSLQDYFRSPEAIQYLLSDREKLCQLLQDNPKLLEMLQERLGQL